MNNFRLAACLSIGLFISLVIYSCKKEPADSGTDREPVMQIPEGFPPVVFPEGNEYTPVRWALGKRLFYDPVLSRNNTVSCASCHIPAYAFSDTLRVSKGDGGLPGRSNAPTLTNVAYQPYYTRAGGVPTLEMQVLVPVQEHDELNTNLLEIAERLKADPSYMQQAQSAYGREIDPYVITRALATFERSLISGNAPYDQYTYQRNVFALSADALRGMELFNSTRTNCSQCHSGFNFTSYAFENNGLYTHYADSGRMRLTLQEYDRARFKVPTLRNIALTAPYMHDGSINTLEEVVAHYNSGGVAHPNKSSLIRPMGLSKQEQADLVAFLRSLTDDTFVNNKQLRKE